MIKRLLSLFKRPSPEQSAREILQDILRHLDQVK